jgi:hypothetical protein
MQVNPSEVETCTEKKKTLFDSWKRKNMKIGKTYDWDVMPS